jgi:hypothetical protein
MQAALAKGEELRTKQLAVSNWQLARAKADADETG